MHILRDKMEACMVLDTSKELKPLSVDIPLDTRVLGKVGGTSVGHPSLGQLAYNLLDKMEAYRVVDTLKA